MYFESKLLYFESKLLYFESILLYFESMLLYFETILLYFESAFLYFESILLHFATMLASGCTENQYRKGKEKVVINVHFLNANPRAVGDNTYAYFCFSNLDNFLGFLGTLGRPLPGSPEDAGGKVPGSIPAAANPSSTSCLILMTMRMMSMTGVIRMMRPVKKRVMKMMQMKMRMRINLRMIMKDKDDKG